MICIGLGMWLQVGELVLYVQCLGSTPNTHTNICMGSELKKNEYGIIILLTFFCEFHPFSLCGPSVGRHLTMTFYLLLLFFVF